MTDAERDSIDNEAQQYMKLCTDAIKQLQDYGVLVLWFVIVYIFSWNQTRFTTCDLIIGSVENIPTQAQIYHKEVQILLENFLKGTVTNSLPSMSHDISTTLIFLNY